MTNPHKILMLNARHRDQFAEVRSAVSRQMDQLAKTMKRIEAIELEMKEQFEELFAEIQGDRQEATE